MAGEKKKREEVFERGRDVKAHTPVCDYVETLSIIRGRRKKKKSADDLSRGGRKGRPSLLYVEQSRTTTPREKKGGK